MISTLTVYVCACVGLALCPTSSYGAFLFLRVLQAIGGSPLIALGAGVVSDIASSAERGKFMGLFSGVAMVSLTAAWRWLAAMCSG